MAAYNARRAKIETETARGTIPSMKMKFVGAALVAVLGFNVHLSPAFAQGATAFTYQGRLQSDGTDVTGTNGMIFALYSAQTGGTAVTTPITNNVAVSNGLFTVNLDFGAGAFNGGARWLDIAISNGVTNVDLSPRTQVLPTPYATFAATAASATSAATATNVVGGVVATGTFVGNGAGLTNVAANLQMEVFSTPGTFSFTVPTNVSTIIVEAWGGGGGGGSGNASYDTCGGGGGGGGYTKIYYQVAPGTYPVSVGAGGGAGAAGGNSEFDNIILATGGSAGSAGSSSALSPGGAGGSGIGTATNGTGIKGGTGKFGTVDGGGDGGSAGGGGATGGLGNLGSGGTAGNSPGGGGGGGAYTGTITGYAGGSGEVIVYY